MRQLLNTLFITSEDIYAALEGENIVLKRDGKDSLQFYNVGLYSPTPHGVGGLKFLLGYRPLGLCWSHPSRGGWIEIYGYLPFRENQPVPPLTGWVD